MLITRKPALPVCTSVKLRVPWPFPEIHKIARGYDIIDNPPVSFPLPEPKWLPRFMRIDIWAVNILEPHLMSVSVRVNTFLAEDRCWSCLHWKCQGLVFLPPAFAASLSSLSSPPVLPVPGGKEGNGREKPSRGCWERQRLAELCQGCWVAMAHCCSTLWPSAAGLNS